MQDSLPDLPRVDESTRVEAGVSTVKPSFFQRFRGVGSDDKRLVKLILIIGFSILLLLGIAAAILEQVAPRGVQKPGSEELFSSSLWQIKPQPNQIILGFFEDKNQNNQFDYQEKPFDKVSVAIRRSGETEPFRRVSAGTDGLVKIDDLAQGDYELSYDNYSQPEAADWQFFEEYQHQGEFFPTSWRRVSLTSQGYKEFIGVSVYQPPLLLALAGDTGLTWYDPERARVYAKSNFNAQFISRGKDVFYLQEGKLKKLDWQNRTVTEAMIWLEEAEKNPWWLSPEAKTVAYLTEGELNYRSQIEECSEGGLLLDGVRLEVTAAAFIDETNWLVIGRGDQPEPWQLFKANCGRVEAVVTVAEPVSVGYLGGADWFYATAQASYLYDSAAGKAVKYAALGGGEGASVTADNRYLFKKSGEGDWLVVDYPAVKASGVEKHYALTGISGEPTIVGGDVYFVRSKPCEADGLPASASPQAMQAGDCGEVVKISLQGSGVWEVTSTWDLKNVATQKVLGVVN